MKPLSADTSLEAQLVLVRGLQRMSPERRLQVTAASIRSGLQLKKPELDTMDPFAIAARVTAYFEREGIEYFLGGSLASTVYGEPRFTQDVDIVVRLKPGCQHSLAAEFQEEFYVSEAAIAEAVARKSSANLIHFESNFKVDLIVSRERPFEISRFARKIRISAGKNSFWFCSAEDIVLAKLEWYRGSGEVLERQLRDVQTVLMVQEALDLNYLKHWADQLRLRDLLDIALKDAARG